MTRRLGFLLRLVQAFLGLVLLACWHGGVSAKPEMTDGLLSVTSMGARFDSVVDVGNPGRSVHVDRLADSQNGLQVVQTRATD